MCAVKGEERVQNRVERIHESSMRVFFFFLRALAGAFLFFVGRASLVNFESSSDEAVAKSRP
ncbi:hypothetical protein BDW72DRAFT_85590 [Aspergillus terricola var. indicus]